MAGTQYTWDESHLETREMCRSKACQKAHYKDGKPKQQLVLLQVYPQRTAYLNQVLFCPRCKGTKIPGW